MKETTKKLMKEFKNEIEVFMNNTDYTNVVEDEDVLIFSEKNNWGDTYYIRINKHFNNVTFCMENAGDDTLYPIFIDPFTLKELIDLLRAMEMCA